MLRYGGDDLAMSARHLLGFDAREMWLPFTSRGNREGGWTQQQKSEWLLRADVDRPLSVDYLVWTSVFSPGAGLVPSWVYGDSVQGIWSKLSELYASLPESLQQESAGRYWIIGINVEGRGALDPAWNDIMTVPAVIQEDWEFLGYDVADRWLLSGLSNCTHVSEKDFDDLRRRFLDHINSYHLFTDYRVACKFRSLSGRRVPDHKPFYVFGLWHLPSGFEKGDEPKGGKRESDRRREGEE